MWDGMILHPASSYSDNIPQPIQFNCKFHTIKPYIRCFGKGGNLSILDLSLFVFKLPKQCFGPRLKGEILWHRFRLESTSVISMSLSISPIRSIFILVAAAAILRYEMICYEWYDMIWYVMHMVIIWCKVAQFVGHNKNASINEGVRIVDLPLSTTYLIHIRFRFIQIPVFEQLQILCYHFVGW